MIKIDPNKTILCQNSNGIPERIPLKDIDKRPIIHQKLNDNILDKISGIYHFLGFNLQSDNKISLEHFEIKFMKEYDIEKAIEQWKIIAKIFQEYIEKHDIELLNETYDVIKLAFLIINDYDFSEENKNNLTIQKIQNIFNKIKEENN